MWIIWCKFSKKCKKCWQARVWAGSQTDFGCCDSKDKSHAEKSWLHIGESIPALFFLALLGRRYYERVEDLRCHLEETPWDWSSGGPSASSCGAPHPKLGIYSGGMSGSGDWQVSGPLKGQPLHWKLGQFIFLHGNNWKDSVAGVCTGTGSFYQWLSVNSIVL